MTLSAGHVFDLLLNNINFAMFAMLQATFCETFALYLYLILFTLSKECQFSPGQLSEVHSLCRRYQDHMGLRANKISVEQKVE